MSVDRKTEGQKPYRVLKIDELTRVGDIGGIEKYYRATIRTRAGVTLTVDIDEGDFTQDKVAAILKGAAVNADSIMQI